MPRHSLPFPHSIAPGCAEFADSENSLWMATNAGEIVTFRLHDSRITVRGGGYVGPVAVLPAQNGLEIYVVEAEGRILVAARAGAARAEAAVVAELENEVAGARLHPDGGAALVMESGGSARLLRVSLADGTSEAVAEGLEFPSALAVEPNTRQAVILERPANGARLVAIDIDSGALTILGTADEPAALVTAPDTAAPGVILAGGVSGETGLRSLGGAPDLPGPVVGGSVRALTRWHSLLLAVTATSVEAIEWGLQDGTLPITVPLGPAFVGGWFRAEINPAAIGIAASDVQLTVDEGPIAGTVSAGIEPPAPGGALRLRVLTGRIPGEYHLSATRKSDGSLLGQARFRVTRHWPDPVAGPPVASNDISQLFLMWGGGPDAAQNIGNHRAPEEWRVAIVLVGTTDKPLPADTTALQNTWRDRLVAPAGLSARNYYREVSYHGTPGGPGSPHGTTISHAAPILVLNLKKGWGDYFEQPKGKGNWHGWNPQQTGMVAITGEFCEMLDATGQGPLLQNMDAVVYVIHTASDGWSVIGTKLGLALYVWPQALRKGNGTEFWRQVQHPGSPGSPGPKTTTFRNMPILFMPSHAPSMMPTNETLKRVDHTFILCHELGHTLGCEDLYDTGDLPGELDPRLMRGLDVMGTGDDLPHFSLPNRMRLGWIGEKWIERVDFSVNAAPKTVVLQAAETLRRTGPPTGRAAGIEIRVRDGWNYYFEYRREQAGQLGDQELDKIAGGGQFVVGTDVIVLGNTGMIAGGDGDVRRPRILRLPVDADGDGPVLDATGEDYEETDLTNPDAAHDFRLRFEGVEAGDQNAARVRVEYVAARRADLRIRPAPGQGNWKSPDIDLDGPKGMNAVAKGLEHTIIVRVRNAGTEDARSVRVRVAWLPFTTSPGPWTNLPDPPRQDIPKSKTVEFHVKWTPPASVKVGAESAEHFCVKADVDRYVDPSDPTHSEIVIGNNWAQSNFDSTEVAHGSPSERRTTAVAVTNRLARTATYLTVADQDSPLLRTYIGNAWLRLEPGETAAVELAYESLAGDPLLGNMFEQEFEALGRKPPPMLSLTSLVLSDPPDGWISPQVVWGANLSVRIGRRTRVRIVGLLERVVRGTVVFIEHDAFQPVTRGRVNVALWTADRPERQFLCGDNVNATGRFDAVVPREIADAVETGVPILGEALYLGAWPWVASRSGVRRLR